MNVAELRAMLARKVGPLPLGAWLAVAVVGVMAAAAIARHRRGGPAPEPDAPDANDGPQPATLPGGFTVAGSTGGGAATATGGSPSDPFESNPPELRTNTDWEVAANRYLIGRGMQPTVVAAALALYLQGEALTAQQVALVDSALTNVGPTPEPVPPPQTTAATATPTSSTPAPVLTSPGPTTPLGSGSPTGLIVVGSTVVPQPAAGAYPNPYSRTPETIQRISDMSYADGGPGMTPALAAQMSLQEIAQRFHVVIPNGT